MYARLAPLTLAVLVLLTGCAQEQGADKRPAAPGVAGASREHAGRTITVYGDQEGPGAELDRLLASRFGLDTGVRVNLVPRPDSSNQTYQLYQRLLSSPNDALDVLAIDVIWPGALAPHLRDLSADFAAEAQAVFPELVRNDTIDGKLVAMPWYVDAGLLFYRTDLLKRHQFTAPPVTWDELTHHPTENQAPERKTRPGFSGFVWQGRPGEGLTCNALEWQVSHGGGGIFDDMSGHVNVANPLAVAAFSRAAGWIGTISPREVTRMGETETLAIFRRGDAAFMRSWPYAYSAAQQPGSAIVGQVGVAPLPQGPDGGARSAATLGGWQLGVAKKSQSPEAAKAYVRYVCSPEAQRWRALAGSYLPCQPAAYQDPDLLAAWPFFAIMPAVLEGAVARPSSRAKERYASVSRLYAQGVSAVLAGEAAQDATARTARAITQAMK